MRQLLATTLLAFAITSTAQEALWESSAAVSPQLNADGTYTFRITAPKATEVTLWSDALPMVRTVDAKGDSITTRPLAQLSRGEAGVWEYTTPFVPAPELYSYTFFVDSVRTADLSNVYLIRDVTSVNNIFIPGAGPDSLYIAGRDVPRGDIAKVWYRDRRTGADRRMTVYTPAAYRTEPTRRFPVLYLLHGMGGDENAWSELGRASQILDNLIARGEAEPMIVVMPNGNPAQTAAPGETAAGLYTPTMALPHTMDGTFEEGFFDIIEHVDSHYRTVPGKQNMAIAGLSMGGFHALHISKQYPDTFGYVGLFSAATKPLQPSDSPVYKYFDAKLKRQFSTPPALYWIGIGRDDFLYDLNTELRAQLDDIGAQYEYVETDGGHQWRNWRRYLTDFSKKLFK